MKETKMTELLGLRKGEGRTVFYLMSYLTLQCFGTSLGIAIGTSMLLAQVGADKITLYIRRNQFCCTLFFFNIPGIDGTQRKSIPHMPKLYMIIGFLIILICNFMIRRTYT